MSRNTEFQFVSTDAAEITNFLITVYENLTGVSVRPASPEKLFAQWVASVIIQERVYNNYTANQNIPSRAEGKNLDALAELYYLQQRPQAKPTYCTERFTISEAQTFAILVPKGTRVTDASNTMIWETVADAYINAGDTYVDTAIRCQTDGTVGNGYAVGQLNVIVDVFDYYTSCTNITTSDDGSEIASDKEFYELMRESMFAFSTAGAVGSYIYHAKSVSTEIADVQAVRPAVVKKVTLDLYTKGGVKYAFWGGDTIDLSSLAVYAKGSSTAASADTDYTVTYENGLLQVAIAADGALASASQIDVSLTFDGAGHVDIYALMCDKEHIREAIVFGSKDKHDRRDVRRVLADVDGYTDRVYDLLQTQTFVPAQPKKRSIYDNSSRKWREIEYVPFFPDGIIHTLMVLAAAPGFLRGMNYWCCASVPGRGGKHALRRCKRVIHHDKKGSRYVCKMDVHHFYHSVDRRKLIWMLAHKIKDKKYLKLTWEILQTCEQGLAIGFFICQWLANFYLESLDRYITTLDGVKYSVRYILSKIDKPVETDCSAFMMLCAVSAGVDALKETYRKQGNSCTTYCMMQDWPKTGEFELLTDRKYLASDAYLRRGDILVSSGHTVMALENGEKEDDMDKETFTELFREMRKDLQDNDCSDWSEAARQWAVNNSIVQGGAPLPDGSANFMWQDMMTREQLVTVLYRFAQKLGMI